MSDTTALDITELRNKGLENLAEEELTLYIDWQAEMKAKQLYIDNYKERVEELQKAVTASAEDEATSAAKAFEEHITNIMNKIQERL